VTAGQYDATFIWETVRNAEAYEFVLNDEAQLTVEGVSITLEDLEEATEYTIKMRALAPQGSTTWLDSDYCTPVKFATACKKQLAKPTLKATDVLSHAFTISWTPVRNAAKYVYVVGDGAEQELYETQLTVTDLNYFTDYSVKVKAVPSDEMFDVAAESEWATITVKTQNVTELAALNLKSSAIGSAEFTVTWDAVPHAVKYVCELNGSEPVEVTDTFVTFNGLRSQTSYSVVVYAVAADENLKSPRATITVTTKKGPSPDDKGGNIGDFEEKPIF
jgi:chitodextrinase